MVNPYSIQQHVIKRVYVITIKYKFLYYRYGITIYTKKLKPNYATENFLVVVIIIKLKQGNKYRHV